MTKKRVVLMVLGGTFLIMGCLLVLKDSLNQLPPDSVKPNAKPAAVQVSDKSTMKVNVAPASPTLKVATASAVSESLASSTQDSTSTAKNCAQPASLNKLTSASVQEARASSPALLKEVISGTASAPRAILSSELQSPLLDVAGSLNE